MDKLIFGVVMLFQVSNNNLVGTATGFFYQYDNNTYLVTNRHVVEYSSTDLNAKLVFKIHTDAANLKKLKDIIIPLNIKGKTQWHSFDDPNIDIAVIPIPENLLKNSIISSFSSSNFPSRLISLEIGTELLALGYPRSYTDKFHYTPIAKSCIISTPVNIPFEDQGFFLMDGNLFPGMSGSPIILKPSSSYDSPNGVFMPINDHVYFLGIHSSSIIKKVGEKYEPEYKFEDGAITIDLIKKVAVTEKLGLQSCWYGGLIEKLIADFEKQNSCSEKLVVGCEYEGGYSRIYFTTRRFRI